MEYTVETKKAIATAKFNVVDALEYTREAAMRGGDYLMLERVRTHIRFAGRADVMAIEYAATLEAQAVAHA